MFLLSKYIYYYGHHQTFVVGRQIKFNEHKYMKLIKFQSEDTARKTSQTGYRERNLGLDPNSLISVLDIDVLLFINHYIMS